MKPPVHIYKLINSFFFQKTLCGERYMFLKRYPVEVESVAKYGNILNWCKECKRLYEEVEMKLLLPYLMMGTVLTINVGMAIFNWRHNNIGWFYGNCFWIIIAMSTLIYFLIQ